MRMALKLLRIKHGFSQEKMAVRLGYSRNQYARIETGDQEATLRFLEALSNAFGMTLGEARKVTEIDKKQQAQNDRKTRGE